MLPDKATNLLLNLFSVFSSVVFKVSGIQFWVDEQLKCDNNYTGEFCPQQNRTFSFSRFHETERLLVFLMFVAVHCRKTWTCRTGLLSGGI